MWRSQHDGRCGLHPPSCFDGTELGHVDYRYVGIDLLKRIDDTPGSWTTMLAVQPPTRWMGIDVPNFGLHFDKYSYMVESAYVDGLRLGELVAVLAGMSRAAGLWYRSLSRPIWFNTCTRFALTESSLLRSGQLLGCSGK